MIKRVAIALAVFLTAGSVRAQDCPKESPDDVILRRALAKKWFSKGEMEARAGNDIAALKSYQCSLTFVAHGFTAYNIAQIAEKIGDVEVAIAGYTQYLLLVPDAKDEMEVNERLKLLKDRLAKAREVDKGPVEGTTTPPLDKLVEPPQEPAPIAKPVVPETPVTEPVVSEEPSGRSSSKRRLAGWITVGGGGVLLLGGVLSNVLARGQMDTCRSEYEKKNQSAAESACSAAKPLAYLSYGLFGLGAAAVATGAFLLIVHPSESSDVAVDMLPEGGLSLRWAGRF